MAPAADSHTVRSLMSVRVWTRTRTRIVGAVGVLLVLAVVAAASAAPLPIDGPTVSIGQGTGSLVVAPAYPTGLATGPLPGSLVTPGAVSAGRPWSSSRPTGHGRLYAVYLPAPWTGGIRTAIEIDIYLPPGYDAGSARYPVIYEVPYSAGTWQNGMHLSSVLDALITSGSIPPEIVVFAGQFGGPYADSECANSFDGREWFDRFVATTLVHWVDTHLRTITTPAARATFGFSQGGYCSAAILAHHPASSAPRSSSAATSWPASTREPRRPPGGRSTTTRRSSTPSRP